MIASLDGRTRGRWKRDDHLVEAGRDERSVDPVAQGVVSVPSSKVAEQGADRRAGCCPTLH